MWVWIWVWLRPRPPPAGSVHRPAQVRGPRVRCSGSPSRSAGSSTWITFDRPPPPGRNLVAERQRDLATGLAGGGRSSRTNDHWRMVTGPVSIPFTGRVVRIWAYRVQTAVIGPGRATSPKTIGGFGAPRPVALDPALLGERAPRRVVRRSTPPYRPAPAPRGPARRGRLLLAPDHLADLVSFRHASYVAPGRVSPRGRPEPGALVGLREGADRGGRNLGQRLPPDAQISLRAGPSPVRVNQSGVSAAESVPHCGIDHPRRPPARSACLPTGGEHLLHRRAALSGCCQLADLNHLLLGEGQPRSQLRVQSALPLQAHGARGGASRTARSAPGPGPAWPAPAQSETGPDRGRYSHTLWPSTTPSERAIPSGTQLQGPVQVPTATDQVKMDRRHRQGQGRLQVGAQLGEVEATRSLEPGRGPAQSLIGDLEGLQDLHRQVLAEAWLVDLDPLRSGRPAVGRASPRTQAGARPRNYQRHGGAPPDPLLSLRKVTGPSSTGRVWIPSAFASRNSSTGFEGDQAEPLIGGKLGVQVVVVRVEPLGHVQGRYLGPPRRCPWPWRTSSPREGARRTIRTAQGSPPPSARCRGRGRRARSRCSECAECRRPSGDASGPPSASRWPPAAEPPRAPLTSSPPGHASTPGSDRSWGNPGCWRWTFVETSCHWRTETLTSAGTPPV